jgi:hypothetical protein
MMACLSIEPDVVKWFRVDTLGDLDRFAMFQSRRILVCFVAVWLVLTGAAPPVAGQGTDLFTVRGIPIDATADDAVTARRQALEQGQQEGLDRLLRRLVPASEHHRLPEIAGRSVEPYVQNFEIADEQLSNTRYLANLTVGFAPNQIRDLLQAERLPFAEVASTPIVMLPLYQDQTGARIWPEANPWWQAWADQLDSQRLLRLMMPLGDLEDSTALSVEQALAGDEAAMLKVAERYDAADVLLVIAEPLNGPGGDTLTSSTVALPISLQLTVRRIGAVSQTNGPMEFVGSPGQSLEEVLRAAVTNLQNSLDEEWKSANLLRLDQGGLMFLEIPISNLRNWAEISRNLESLPEVSQVDVQTFARELVQAQIYYVGDQTGFERALDELGLALSREGDSWLLHPKGVKPNFDEPPSERPTSF